MNQGEGQFFSVGVGNVAHLGLELKSNMSSGTDKLAGVGMIFVAMSVFLYYTVWVIILPFVKAQHDIHQYFLPREYAVTIPISAGLVVLCALGAFIGVTVLKSRKPKVKAS